MKTKVMDVTMRFLLISTRGTYDMVVELDDNNVSLGKNSYMNISRTISFFGLP